MRSRDPGPAQIAYDAKDKTAFVHKHYSKTAGELHLLSLVPDTRHINYKKLLTKSENGFKFLNHKKQRRFGQMSEAPFSF